MRVGVASLLWMVAGCGRLGFDDRPVPDTTDARPVAEDANLAALLTGCLLRMEMEEPVWADAPDQVLDSCGGGYHGRPNGGATTIVDPQRGRVGVFPGGNACVQVADAGGLEPTTALTMSAWVYPAAQAPGSFGVISRRTDVGVDAAFSMFIWTEDFGAGSANQLYVDIDTENDRVPDPTTELLNAWHQVTVVFDGTLPANQRLVFHVDGQRTFAAPESSTSIPAPTGTPALAVGCLPLSGPAQGFIGRLDEVVLWSRALSAGEVATWHALSVR